MRWYLKLLCVLALGAAWQAADAQERKGLITGLVTDSAHAILQGASVELQPTGKKTVSDNTGQFSIADVAPGTYTLTHIVRRHGALLKRNQSHRRPGHPRGAGDAGGINHRIGHGDRRAGPRRGRSHQSRTHGREYRPGYDRRHHH